MRSLTLIIASIISCFLLARLVSGQTLQGVPAVSGSPWVSAGFPTTIAINSPDLPILNGAIAYLPMQNSAPVRSASPVTFRILLPNSLDANYPGCNPYRYNYTDDGTPLAGNALLVLARSTCSQAQKVQMANALGLGALLLYDNQPSITIANMPSVYIGDFTKYSPYPVLSICQTDGNKLFANLAFNKTGNSQTPIINFTIKPAGRMSAQLKASMTALAVGATYTRTHVGYRPWSDMGNPSLDPCWDAVFGLWCEDGKLVHLDLYTSGWSSSFNSAIGDLTDLVFFDAHVNNLAGPNAFPQEICNLRNLAYIRIESNPALTAFPDCFDQLPLIAFVAFGDAIGSSITTMGAANNLVYVNMHGNPMTGAAFASWNSPNIEILDLGNSNSAGGIVGALPSLSGLSKLQKLDLSFNNFTGSSVSMFNNLPVLSSIILRSNLMAMNLPTFSGCPLMQTIDLTYNQFTGVIPSTWGASMPLVRSLALAHNLITSGSNAAAMNGLVTLDLSWNRIGLTPPYSAPNNWCQLLPTYSGPSLAYLDVSHNLLGGPAFAGSFTAKKTVQWLDFSYNQITSLPSDFFAHTNISHFDISHNALTAAALPAGSPTNTYVYLDFSSNPLFSNPPTASFPTWLSYSTTVTSKLLENFSCRQFQTVGSSLNPALNVIFDANYFHYEGCKCQSGTYGTPPQCYAIPSSNSDLQLSPVLVPYANVTANLSAIAIQPRSLSDAWYGDSRALPGLDVSWTIDVSSTRLVVDSLSGQVSQYVAQSASPALAANQYIDKSRSLIIDLFFDLAIFNAASDQLDIFTGGSDLKGTRLLSFRGDQIASLQSLTMASAQATALSAQSRSILAAFSSIGYYRVSMYHSMLSLNFKSRAVSQQHFYAVYSASNTCPSNYADDGAGGCAIILPEYIVSTSLRNGIYAASAAIAFLVLACAAIFFVHRDSTIVRASSRIFTSFILLMLFFMAVSAPLYAIVPEVGETNICNARLWCSCLSLIGVLGVLVAKSFRVSVIFGSKILLQIKNVTDTYVGAMSFTLILVQVLMLAIFSGTKMSQGQFQHLTINGTAQIVKGCGTMNGFDEWLGVQIAIFASLMVAGGVVAFRTRSVPSAFNESTHILLSLELLTIFLILIVPIDWLLLKDTPEPAMAIHAGGQLIICLFLLLSNFAPKLYYIFSGRGNDKSLVFRAAQSGVTISSRGPDSSAASSANSSVNMESVASNTNMSGRSSSASSTTKSSI